MSPLTLLSYLSSEMQITAMMTLIAGSLLALNQMSNIKIITHSSMYNMGFII